MNSDSGPTVGIIGASSGIGEAVAQGATVGAATGRRRDDNSLV